MEKKDAFSTHRVFIIVLFIGMFLLLSVFSFNAFNSIQGSAVSASGCPYEKLYQTISVIGLNRGYFWLPADETYSKIQFNGLYAELSCSQCTLSINGQLCYSGANINRDVVDLGKCLPYLREGKNIAVIDSDLRGSTDTLSTIYAELSIQPASC